MPEPTSDDDLPIDRWVIPLHEPATPPAAPPDDASPPELLRFPIEPDVPSDEFQPRLIRFGKAG
ncbi:MAG: hypothetical protein MUF18_05295 [Fimbriiglobus sp.]|jgi:hypothetical protein|nr:hypothetical protein [Fimbriiglobus sp.]